MHAILGFQQVEAEAIDGDVERQGDRGWQRSLRFLRCSRQCGFVPERERITFCEAQQDLPAGILIE